MSEEKVEIMEFRKYDHVSRLGHPDVDGLHIGLIYVFPKLDGANASIWLDDKAELQCGSRTQQLDESKTLQGFHSWVQEFSDCLLTILCERPSWRLYGEWLVPHTLKTYRPDAWRSFYAFDVFDHEMGRHVPFTDWWETVEDAGIPVVHPLCTIKNASEDQIRAQVETNTYLIEDGAGIGEGIVIKNYDWQNHHGRQQWAKVVRNEFKEQNRRAFGTTEKHGEFQVEAAIAEEFVTPTLVGKTRAKILADIADKQGLDISEPNGIKRVEEIGRGELIPRLLQTVYSDLVSEDAWEFVKKHKDPKVDFKRLRQHSTMRVKEFAQDLF